MILDIIVKFLKRSLVGLFLKMLFIIKIHDLQLAYQHQEIHFVLI